MPSPRALTIGTAGHVDHGKTALVQALTGTDTDRLAEERRRGLSIELGFARLDLAGGRSASVVDVPGHERFIRTMVAGATGIDAFLLVIAADDGVMAQTKEHLTVLRALGLSRGVVAVSKCDLVDAAGRARAREAASALVPGAEVVEVSARTGDGIERLRAALHSLAAAADARACAGAADGWPTPALMHLDRVFSVHGAGTVVTGTLCSGEIRRGDRVELLPSRQPARARSLQVHDREVESASAGTRLACNLAGLGRAKPERGDAIATAGAGALPGFRLDVELDLAPGAALDPGEELQVHHGTRSTPATVVPLDAGFAQLRLRRPLLALAGDRCVLRRASPPGTAGGALVIDPAPPRHRGADAAGRLQLISTGSPEELLSAAVASSPGTGPDRLGWLAHDPADWEGRALLGPALRRFPPSRWREAATAIGSPKTARSRPTGPQRAAVPEPLATLALQILDLLREDGIEARAPQDLAAVLGVDREAVLEALTALVSKGDVVMIKPSFYIEPSALRRARAHLVELIDEHGSITLAEARDGLVTSRRRAQALLDHLDSLGLTIRRGDARTLRRSAGRAAKGD